MIQVPIIKLKLKDVGMTLASKELINIHIPRPGIQCIQKHCLDCHRDNLFHLADAREYFYGVKCGKCKTEVWGKQSPSRLITKKVIEKMNEAALALGKKNEASLNKRPTEELIPELKELSKYFLGDMPPCPCCGNVFSEWNFGWPDIYKNCLHCKSENMTPYADVTKDHLEDELYWFDD